MYELFRRIEDFELIRIAVQEWQLEWELVHLVLLDLEDWIAIKVKCNEISQSIGIALEDAYPIEA